MNGKVDGVDNPKMENKSNAQKRQFCIFAE